MRLRQYRNVETQASSAVSDFLENRQANAVAESLKAKVKSLKRQVLGVSYVPFLSAILARL